MLEYIKLWASEYIFWVLFVVVMFAVFTLLDFARVVVAAIDFYWSKVKRIFRRDHAN